MDKVSFALMVGYIERKIMALKIRQNELAELAGKSGAIHADPGTEDRARRIIIGKMYPNP